MKNYLPIEYEVGGRPALVVGADALVRSKIDRLLAAGAAVSVYACGRPASAAVAARAAQGAIHFDEGAPERVALERAAIVFVSPALAARFERGFRAAREQGRLWCTLDRPELSTFTNPAALEISGIELRLASGGASPALLRRLREDLERLLADPALARFVERLAALRGALPRGVRAATMRAAVQGFALAGELKFPRWFVEGADPPDR